MAAVRWSRRAEARLREISPATRDQLVSSAGKILHDITSADFPHDEGCAGEVMWHRGIPCGMLSEELLAQEDDDGPWDYYLFYATLPPDPEEPDPYQTFEVLDVCHKTDVVQRWRAQRRDIPDQDK